MPLSDKLKTLCDRCPIAAAAGLDTLLLELETDINALNTRLTAHLHATDGNPGLTSATHADYAEEEDLLDLENWS